jgi:membrane-associated protease RseP (regulator of RpoE activity)
MLNEPASSLNDDHPQRRPIATLTFPDDSLQQHPKYAEIHDAIESVLFIENEKIAFGDTQQRRREFLMLSSDSRLLATFTGHLLLESEAAYDRLDMRFAELDLLAAFREDEGKHVIHVFEGRVKPKAGGGRLSLILFLATVLSVLFVGTIQAIGEIDRTDPFRANQILNELPLNLWRGLPYAVSILLILGAHELGHYFMTRRHGAAASLPYFLPFPLPPFGTFGAAIRLREPIRNRKMLFDIGAAGPLTGLIFAIPILLIGLATSDTLPITSGLIEGNSIIYALSKIIVFGHYVPDGTVDVYVNQLAWAGWTGLLVTGLNLIPVGQLDGGHVLYSLAGKQARKAYLPVIAGMILLMILFPGGLIVFTILIIFLGNFHATPLDDITKLDKRRRNLAIFTLIIFALVFVPVPLTQTVVRTGPISEDGFVMLPAVTMTLWMRLRRSI